MLLFYIIIPTDILAIIGNILLVCVVIFGHNMRTKTNFIIASMAFSDFLYSAFGIFWKIIDYDDQILSKKITCFTIFMVLRLSLYVSGISTVIIALDRYSVLVLNRKTSYLKIMKVSIWILIIWTLSIILTIPYVFTSWPSKYCGAFNSTKLVNAWMAIYYGITSYLIPSLITVFCYTSIGIVIIKRKSVGSVTAEHQAKLTKSKMKSLRLVIIITAALVGTQFLWNIYLQLRYVFMVVNPQKNKIFLFISIIFTAIYVLCNPIICLLFTQKFRSKLRISRLINRNLSQRMKLKQTSSSGVSDPIHNPN